MGVTNYDLLGFDKDASGKRVVVGSTRRLGPDTNFTDGTPSSWGKGSIALDRAGGIHVVDADGLWQTPTLTTASPSVSPSASRSPSASASPSASRSPSASLSPSASASPSA